MKKTWKIRLALMVAAMFLLTFTACVSRPGVDGSTGPIKAVECVSAPQPEAIVPVSSSSEQGAEASSSTEAEEVAASSLSSEREAGVSSEVAAVDDREAKFRATREEFEKAMVHFDYDLALIRAVDIPILDKQAEFLKASPMVTTTILGHCDERGTADYNLALGQRRADAIKDYLVKKGIAADRMEAVSMGAEAPLDKASTEAAWAMNRRGEFIIK